MSLGELAFPSLAAPSPPPTSLREQQLYAATLDAYGNVREVLLPDASHKVREAASSVLASKDALQHWEGALGGPEAAAHHCPQSFSLSPVSERARLSPLGTYAGGTSLPPVSPLSNLGPQHELAPPLLAGARDSMAVIHVLDRRRDGAYARILHYLLHLAAPDHAACDMRATVTADRVKIVLGLDRLVSTRPDVVFGLDPLRITVSPGPSSKPLLDPGTQVQLYAASINDLVANLGDSPSAPWFPWVFCSTLPLCGDFGKAHLDNLTAMRLGLGLVVRLARRAHETDPVHSLPIPLLCQRMYGVQAVGSVWRLFLMVNEGDEYTATEIWCGSACVPSSMVQFLGIMSSIAGEANVRHDYISNWLFSLRSTSSLIESGVFTIGRQQQLAPSPIHAPIPVHVPSPPGTWLASTPRRMNPGIIPSHLTLVSPREFDAAAHLAARSNATFGQPESIHSVTESKTLSDSGLETEYDPNSYEYSRQYTV